MESIFKQAESIQEDIVNYRRYLHENAETGFSMEKSVSFISQRLKEFGYSPKPCGKAGVQVCVGKGGKVFLLRADIDGLPLREKTGFPFACTNGNMHACGHDMHAAMLLGAARILKENEAKLCGRVKLLFQPAEEILQGAKDCIEGGVLQNPKVDAAMTLHVLTGLELPTGSVVVSSKGVSAPAADYFSVSIKGKGCHGSTPWKGVDALSVAAYTLLALHQLPAREIALATPSVLTVGKLEGGKAGNVIAEEAVLQGTLRSFDEETRARIKKRIQELANSTAKAFHARAKISFEGGCPTLINDRELSVFVKESLQKLFKEDVFSSEDLKGNKEGGSEDFAYISQEVPSVALALCAGAPSKGYRYPLHNPKTIFDESVLYKGAAIYAHAAIEWLKEGAGTR